MVEIHQQQNANEKHIKEFDELYNPWPVLKLKKLFETHFGYISLKQIDLPPFHAENGSILHKVIP